jgi:hypothetical protein
VHLRCGSPEDATAFLKASYTEQHILAVILHWQQVRCR